MTATASDNLRSLGIPTTGTEYGQAATVAGIASLIALVVGSVLGGALGERWHARLVARAADPTVGAQAAAAREAEQARTRANLALARSEGRVRAHELERQSDRERVTAQEQALDDERDRRTELAREREDQLGAEDGRAIDEPTRQPRPIGTGARGITRRRSRAARTG